MHDTLDVVLPKQPSNLFAISSTVASVVTGPETADIEPLLKSDAALCAEIRACLWDSGPDGPGFPEAVESWAEKKGLVQPGAKRMRASEPTA